jgi:hypothetical protein
MRHVYRIALLLIAALLIGCESQSAQDPTPTSTAGSGVQDWVLDDELDVGLLSDIASLGPDKVWAVGQSQIRPYVPRRAVVVHWDGSAWRKVAELGAGDQHFHLSSISVISENDIWAVGGLDDYFGGPKPNGAIIAHWDGTVWKIVPGPDLGAASIRLFDVTAISSDNVWAVGQVGWQPLVLHWNGKTWETNTDLAGTADASLKSVSALSDRNIWAVGWAGKESLVVHFDGTNWQRIPSPSYSTHPEAELWTYLNGVAALAENDVWAVGYATDHFVGGSLPSEIPIIMHWDGDSWKMKEDESGPPQQSSYILQKSFGGGFLSSVSALSTADVWAVGRSYSRVPVVIHWNGQALRKIGCPTDKISFAPSGTDYTSTIFFGAARVLPDQVWAVGSYFTEYGPTHRRTGYVIKLADHPCPTPTPIPTEPPPPTPIPDFMPTPLQTPYPLPVPSGHVPRPVRSVQPIPTTVPR